MARRLPASFVRTALVVAAALAVLPAAAPADEPPAPAPPKTEGGVDPKKPEPAPEGKQPGANEPGAKQPDEAAPAPSLDQVLADLADAKFTVKRLDAAAASKQFQDPRITPLLVKLLRDEFPDVRLAAIDALSTRGDAEQKKKAADALGDRLNAIADKVEHESERMKVIDALHDLAQVSSIAALIDKLDYGTSLTEVDARCRAVANVPSPKAIEALIGFMQKRHRDGTGYRGACNKALMYATGERGANDADMWRAWWKDHEKTFDFQAAYDKRQGDARAKEEAAQRKEKAREKREGGGGKGGKKE